MSDGRTGGPPDRDERNLRDRIAAQFGYESDRADIWRGFEAFLETDRYLNLGYSGRFESHLLGSPQQRLADRVLAETERAGAHGPLLDLGCGRGGPAIRAADRGFEVIGIDLVRYNVARAIDRATSARSPGSSGPVPQFAVGDATALPIRTGAVGAAVAIDSLVYVPEKTSAFRELRRALAEDGVVLCSDLVAAAGADRDRLARFGEAWDMPPPPSVEQYRSTVADAGLRIDRLSDLTPNSVGRLRTWTRLFLTLDRGPAASLIEGLLARRDIDPGTVRTQVRAAHEALPDLRHVLVVARPRRVSEGSLRRRRS